MSDYVPHRPVLYNEIIHALQPRENGLYVDGTVGMGGHAFGILKASHPDGCLLGLDVDPQALMLARERLAPFGKRAILYQASFANLREHLDNLEWGQVDGILLDLGVSSLQLDRSERGFSFQSDGPLDMRFDPTNPVQAADLVNNLSEDELAKLLFEYGEERRSRQIARAIVHARPIYRTSELADIVARNTDKLYRRIHPATRTFQALRIAVNKELDNIKSALPQTVDSLKPGGRLAVIAFHSLEDRIVKHFLRNESKDCICPPKLPQCNCGHIAKIKEINRRPIRPSETEVKQNPRSRSACLRVAEKI